MQGSAQGEGSESASGVACWPWLAFYRPAVTVIPRKGVHAGQQASVAVRREARAMRTTLTVKHESNT